MRHVLNVQFRQEVIFISIVAGCPNEPRSNDLGFCFSSQFYFPLGAVLIADIKFWAASFEIFLNKCKCGAGCMLLSARTVVEIAHSDIPGFLPDRSSLTRHGRVERTASSAMRLGY